MADEQMTSEPSSPDAPETQPTWREQVEYLRELAQIVRDEGLSKLEVEVGGAKITLRGTPPVATPGIATNTFINAYPPFATPLEAASGEFAPASNDATPGAVPSAPAEKLTPVVSPMVGVFYRAPSPDEPNFVEIGDRVERGQTVAIIEAMKVFNEITAEASGVVAQLPVENAQLVETGQPIILLK